MGMTLAQMISEAQAGGGDSSVGFRTTIISVINRKRKILARRLKPKATEDTATLSLTVGTTLYTLPNTINFITKANGADGRNITVLSERKFQEAYGTLAEDSETPEILRVFGQDSSGCLKVRIYPVPDAAEDLSLLVHTKPATLADDTDESEMDEGFDQAVMEAVLAYIKVLNDDELFDKMQKMGRDTADDFEAADENASGGQEVTEIAQDPFVEFRREYD